METSPNHPFMVEYPATAVKEMYGGIQYLFFFPNGYGASVCHHKYSYVTEGTWELAVLLGDIDDWGLTYDTEITDDVIGHLPPKEVAQTLERVRAL